MEIKDINLEEYEISTTDKEIIVLRKKKKSKYLKWEDLKSVKGYYIDKDSKIYEMAVYFGPTDSKHIFISKKHAKSALAMAQISQLIPFYGGEITDEEWKDSDMKKYVIMRDSSEVKCVVCYLNYDFLAFHTKEQRDEFLKNNEQLVKDYLMIE